MTDRLPAKVLEILSFGNQPVNQAQRAFGGLHLNCAHQLVQHALCNYAQKLAHLSVRNRVPRVSDGLLDQRKTVAKAAFRCARNHRHGACLDT